MWKPAGWWILIVVGSAFVVVSVFGLITSNDGTYILFLVIGIGVLAAATIGYLRRGVARMRVAAPEVTVSDKPLRVGEQFSMSYRQGWKRATEVSRLRFELVLRETAIYTTTDSDGGGTVTKKHDEVVQGVVAVGQRFEPGQMINENCTFRIPENGMHTFRADNNRIEWYVVACVEMRRWPDYRWEHELTVLPELLG